MKGTLDIHTSHYLFLIYNTLFIFLKKFFHKERKQKGKKKTRKNDRNKFTIGQFRLIIHPILCERRRKELSQILNDFTHSTSSHVFFCRYANANLAD